MKHFSILLICTVLVTAGCAGVKNSGTSETAVDEEMARPLSTASAPAVDPGEPQPGFDQEVLQSQNP